ncbi:hypothetical protein QVD17_24759 [Tagetes erecta]|uniref:Uncharacterized protein n=1 Tax=Tagetes erecta TaxID=13708 RepID=A0AAD8KKG3_TARER|nr:hypothetical protein QVD17_24759 [Tagetes erecta]
MDKEATAKQVENLEELRKKKRKMSKTGSMEEMPGSGAYEHHHNLMDASIPSKNDKWGNVFGFLRFVDVEDADAFKKELEKTLAIAAPSPTTIGSMDGGSFGIPKCQLGSGWGQGVHQMHQDDQIASMIKALVNSPGIYPLAESTLICAIRSADILNDLQFYLK